MTSPPPPPLPSPLEGEGWVGGIKIYCVCIKRDLSRSFGIGALVAMFTGLIFGFSGDFQETERTY